MRRKVIKNEDDELVTKGYLKVVLDQRFFEFEDSFEKKIDKKFDEKFAHYFRLISEDFTDKLKLTVEGFEIRMDYRFKKSEEKYAKLEKRLHRSEDWLSNHEGRILKLESDN